ncbi:MAG: hypothetical protein KDD66_16405, partial [Bdellovibrionales bacterium]|nr:hypothetical protein [Bdellovibrionales bacterium]
VGSRTLGILHESKPLMGSKHLGAVFLGPMPGYKFIFNKLLTMVQNLCYGTSFHSFHCGFRAVSTSCLRKIHFEQLGNWYDYDTEFLIAASELGARIVEVPVKAFYDPNAGSSVPGVRYGLRILWNCAAYLFSSARSHAPQNELNSQGDEARSGHTNTEYDR